jgi:ABC-type transporter Mla maintaining outer membrane lipid asymmetry ATPase subunit MlaF
MACRVALARAIATDLAIPIYDEPFAVRPDIDGRRAARSAK